MFVRKSLAAAVALSLSALLCQAAVADDTTIKLVSSLPRTGSANAQTTSMVNGIKMAIDEVGGKVGSYTVTYEDWDDASPERGAWDPAIEAANADKAVKDPDVMAYIGTYNSGAAKISMPKLNQAGLAMVSPANTWPGLTKPGIGEPNEPKVYRPSGKVTYFRVVPADDIQGYIAAKFSKDQGAKKIFIIHDGELYGKGIAQMFKKSAGPLGLDIVGFEQIDTKASNYRSLAVKIKQYSPDIVYFGGTTQTNAGQLAKDLVAAGVSGKFMVPDGCFESAFIDAAGKENLEGRVFITFGGVPGAQLTGKGKEFYENYKKRFGIEPEGYSAYGYESAKVALDAIRRAGKKDRAAIVDALAATKDFEGALGKWSFDANGDTSLKTMSVNTVKDGQFAFVKLLD
ncbi:MAG: branched-chain amino acid ABC transporter substrate-binding protein [Bdellovibrionota bacterium]